MKLLPVGTVIEVNETKLMIMGYRMLQDEKFSFYYLVSIYPFGFTGDMKSLSLIPIDQDILIVSEGYSDSSTERYRKVKENLIDSLAGADPAELEKVIDMITKEIGK